MKTTIALILGLGLAATPAFAHKAKKNHTHCVKDGTAVDAKGKNDAAKKKACADAGGTWDESKDHKVGSKIEAAKAPTEPATKEPAPAAEEPATTEPAP